MEGECGLASRADCTSGPPAPIHRLATHTPVELPEPGGAIPRTGIWNPGIGMMPRRLERAAFNDVFEPQQVAAKQGRRHGRGLRPARASCWFRRTFRRTSHQAVRGADQAPLRDRA